MTEFNIIPLPSDFAERVRTTMTDLQGNRLEAFENTGERNPCRHCLRSALPGERLITCAYSPFGRPGPYSEVGPIFVHAERCAQYGRIGAFPADLRGYRLALRGYNDRHAIEAAELLDGRPVEEVIAQLFGNPRIAYLHLRSATYGCFICQIERV